MIRKSELKNKDNGDLTNQTDNDKLNYCQGRYDELNWVLINSSEE
jgi:hypothetical protein